MNECERCEGLRSELTNIVIIIQKHLELHSTLVRIVTDLLVDMRKFMVSKK